MQGANLYKEYLHSLDRFPKRASQADFNDSKSTSKVESILVCTGVYNPQNDLLYHLNHLFTDGMSTSQDNLSSETNRSRFSSSDNLSSSNEFYLSSNSSQTNLAQSRPDSVPNLLNLEKQELKIAMSRHNSFIAYFDNKLNVPDITVDNLRDAVDHIIKKEILDHL